MISKARASFVRISPRKVRYVIDQIRAKTVPQAQGILAGSPRRAGEIVRKLLNQAVDAAVKNSHANEASLFISAVYADGGPTMKRFRAMSMGRAGVIRKRTSHIYLELDSKQPVPAAKTQGAKGAPAAAAKVKPVKTAAAGKKQDKKLVGAK